MKEQTNGAPENRGAGDKITDLLLTESIAK